MFARFFIDRPIFASVLSIVITLAGGIAAYNLPLAQYPQIAPPTVQVDCNYPGANARVVAETVAAPIEQQVNGVEDMLYMTSQSTNDGSYTLTVTFKLGVDLNVAQVLVQNRVALALPQLPDVVRQTGVTTKKRSPDILLVVSINSPGGRFDQLYLSNYALRYLRDEIARLPGISECLLFGQRDFSMRVWLDPNKMAARQIAANDVTNALREQNLQIASGQIGQPPNDSGQVTQLVVSTAGRLVEVEEFEHVVVKRTPEGRMVRIKDIGRVELAPRSQDISNRFAMKPHGGRPAVGIAVFQLPDANALETADRVKAKMAELSKNFPDGLTYNIGYDTTPFIRESISEVFHALRDAVILVAIVVLVFLQSWRSAIIPLVAVPVAIVGTFAAMLAVGFSLNNLTLFGLVLAIGIVVDDAIVVVEAVEHHIENGLAPRAAALRAMEEVSGPVIAVGLVLSAVFIPCAFLSGIVGQFFRQFALTIAISTLISAFNSLTLSPALCALLLKPRHHGKVEVLPWPAYVLLGGWVGYAYLAEPLEAWAGPHAGDLAFDLPAEAWPVAAALAAALAGGLLTWPLNLALGAFFRLFNAAFNRTTRGYTRAVGDLLSGRLPLLLLLAVAAGAWAGQALLAAPLGHLLEERLGWAGPMRPWVWAVTGAAAAALATALVTFTLSRLLAWSAARLGRGQRWHARLAGVAVPAILLVVAAYGGMLAMTWWGLNALPTGFIPDQDKGYMLASIQLPDATAAGRTREAMKKLEQIAIETPGVRYTNSIAGNSFILSAYGSNFGSMFIILDPYELRQSPDLTLNAILGKLRDRIATEVPEATVAIFGPPPVNGLGRAGGFRIMVEDRGEVGLNTLQQQTENMVTKMRQQPRIASAFTVFRADSPQLFVDIDRKACVQKEVEVGDVFATLQVFLGSRYVNDFNRFGRTWQVVVQAEYDFRDSLDDVQKLKVRNKHGQMVPLGSVASVREINGPLVLTRYNMYPAAAINGSAAPGVSSGDAIRLVERLAERELPDSMKTEWTEIFFLEKQAGSTGLMVFGFSVLFVFLVLAAEYESWSLPLAVILVVPLCVLSSLAGVALAKHDVNIFTQIGFVVLIGLACKNAILIVEFAKAERERGKSAVEAALAACQLRLRPILMTSFAFILGVVPLVLAHGAGAEMRQVLGTAVFAGMLGVTLFGIFLTPVFFVLIDWATHWRVFQSPLLARVNQASLDLVRLGPARRGLGRLRDWFHRNGKG